MRGGGPEQRRRDQQKPSAEAMPTPFAEMPEAEEPAIPAKARIYRTTARKTDKWIPAFPTEQVRGLATRGVTIRVDAPLYVHFSSSAISGRMLCSTSAWVSGPTCL
jgi:hypothetical protein